MHNKLACHCNIAIETYYLMQNNEGNLAVPGRSLLYNFITSIDIPKASKQSIHNRPKPQPSMENKDRVVCFPFYHTSTNIFPLTFRVVCEHCLYTPLSLSCTSGGWARHSPSLVCYICVLICPGTCFTSTVSLVDTWRNLVIKPTHLVWLVFPGQIWLGGG